MNISKTDKSYIEREIREKNAQADVQAVKPTEMARLQRILAMLLSPEDRFTYKFTRKGHMSLNIKRVSHTAEQL